MSSISTRKCLWLCAVAGLVALLASMLAIPASAAAAAPQWRLVDLGLSTNSRAHAINARGDIVGEDNGRAFLWRNGQVTYLDDEGAGYSVATDINNRGDVVGHRWPGGAFLWRDGMITDLGADFAWAINDHGEVVGDASGNAYIWRDGVATRLDNLPGQLTSAQDLNNSGLVVGSSGFMNTVAVQWPPGGGIQPLTTVQGTTAVAVNDRSQVVGKGFAGPPRAYLWQRDGLTEIEPPQGHSTISPFGVNNRGLIVGDSIGLINDPFVWHRGRFTLLPLLSTIVGGTAHDINDRGQIVGFAGVAPPTGGLEWHAVLWTR